jgi:hypothetical protein
MFPTSIGVRIRRTWLQCQSKQMLRTEANPSIPDSIWRHNKGAIIDTRRPDHDYVQVMTAVNGFGGKWIAINPLDTIVFCMTKHHTVRKSNMTFATG